MSRDPRYQKLLNSPRWAEVKRIVWNRAGGLCERCKRDGIAERGVPYITPGVDCHHIKPVEGAKTVDGPDGMRARAYDPDNIELLCVACHIKTHKEMGKFTPEHVGENKKRRAERTASWLDPHYQTNKETLNDNDNGKNV